MIKKGDVLICVIPGESNSLTAGKEYPALTDEYQEHKETWVKVENDRGTVHEYYVSRFKTKEPAPASTPELTATKKQVEDIVANNPEFEKFANKLWPDQFPDKIVFDGSKTTPGYKLKGKPCLWLKEGELHINTEYFDFMEVIDVGNPGRVILKVTPKPK